MTSIMMGASAAATSAPGATLDNLSSSINSTDGSDQETIAGVRFDSDGNIYERSGTEPTSYSSVGVWLESGSAGDYTIQGVLDSGDALDTGTLNTDLALSTDRTFEQAATAATETSVITFTLKRGSNTLDTKQVTISAVSFSP